MADLIGEIEAITKKKFIGKESSKKRRAAALQRLIRKSIGARSPTPEEVERFAKLVEKPKLKGEAKRRIELFKGEK